MNRRVIIAGCGFVGHAAARLFHEAGWEVIGITRSEESARRLSPEPYRVLACDITDRAVLARANLPDADAVIDCVSAGGGGAEEYRRIYFEGARNLIELLHPRKLLFTSSTSVYAQDDGSWCSEESPAEPTRDTGLVLRSTEDLVLAGGGIVARLAGIYGPGRSMLIRRFFDGSAVIEGDGARHINQIHRDDAAAALFFLVERVLPSGIYNVADDSPTRQVDLYRWLAEHFDRPLPPAGPIDTNRKRGVTDKRVSNAKLRSLGWQPKFPSFRDAIERSSF